MQKAIVCGYKIWIIYLTLTLIDGNKALLFVKRASRLTFFFALLCLCAATHSEKFLQMQRKIAGNST